MRTDSGQVLNQPLSRNLRCPVSADEVACELREDTTKSTDHSLCAERQLIAGESEAFSPEAPSGHHHDAGSGNALPSTGPV